MKKSFAAVGYQITEESISRNGTIERYGDFETLEEAVAAWLYTHQLHRGGSRVTSGNVGHCTKCGSSAIVSSEAQ